MLGNASTERTICEELRAVKFAAVMGHVARHDVIDYQVLTVILCLCIYTAILKSIVIVHFHETSSLGGGLYEFMPIIEKKM